MSKTTIKRTLLILLTGLFVFFQIYLVFIKDYLVLDEAKYINEFPQPLFGNERQIPKIRQTFRSPGPLTRIDVMLGTYAEKSQNGILQLGIYNKRQCLFLKNESINKIKDNRFHTFLIPRGKVPAGRNYLLELRFSPGNGQERLAVWVSLKNTYPYGDFFVNGQKKEGDMNFRVYYRSTLWQARSNLLEKIPQIWFSRLWLLTGLLLLIGALNFLFYYLIKKLT